MFQLKWLWLSIPVFILCLIFIGVLVQQLIVISRDRLIRVPLQAHQSVSIDFNGPALLYVEGPTFSRAFAGLDFQLRDQGSNAEVELNNVWVRLKSSTLKSARVSVRKFDLTQGGDFELVVVGLTSALTDGKHNLVIAPDSRKTLFLRIGVLVFTGMVAIASLAYSLAVAMINR
jgi:hypothetical protein